MIVTDKFVFVHLPRSGGTFVSGVIRKFFPSAHEIGHHMPRELLPREYSHLPVLGTVRNPWEFYVSLYHYVWPKDAASKFVSWMSENGRLGFIGSIRNVLNLGVNDERLDVLIEMLPEHVDYSKRQIPNVTKETMRRVRGTGVGYYTVRFNEMFGNADDVFFCRLKTLRQDLVAFFEGIGAASDELRDYVLSSDEKNISEHLHYSTYYTPELAELVSIRDRSLIERFGYVFERPSSVENGRPRFLRQKNTLLPHHSDNSSQEVEDTRRALAGELEAPTAVTSQNGKNRNTRSSRGTAGTESVFLSEPLIAYKYDPGLAKHEEVIFTVKTTLQLEKNDYQAELMKGPNLGVFGREAARPYVMGIVAAFPLAYDRFDWSLAEAKWAFSTVEPYGVDASQNKMALATAQSVQLINMDTGDARYLQNPWLNQAHTVEFSPDGKKLLVGSSGFDAVFEFDTTSGEVDWQWFAWDHGFDRSKLGHYVVRSEPPYRTLAAMGHEVLLVDDPAKYEFGIPTRHKPAHLNSACYDSDGRILVTLFHQGAGYVVDRNTGEAQEVISGLSNPHKLSRRKRGGYFISDTKGGKLVFFDEKYRPDYEINLARTPGVARSPDLSEFLQNTTELREDLFACIDIHRSSLWLIDVKRRRYRGIKFPVEWSVHDVASVGLNLDRRIGNLVSTQFGKVAAFGRQLKIIHHFAVDGREIMALALDTQGRHRGIDG